MDNKNEVNSLGDFQKIVVWCRRRELRLAILSKDKIVSLSGAAPDAAPARIRRRSPENSGSLLPVRFLGSLLEMWVKIKTRFTRFGFLVPKEGIEPSWTESTRFWVVRVYQFRHFGIWMYQGWELNPRPMAYESTALPLSYPGSYFVAGAGLEPATCGLWARRAANCSTPRHCLLF